MPTTKGAQQLSDWTAVAANTVGESGTLDCSVEYGTELHIQAFLDTNTAHDGTRFIVQVSSNAAGDEDWQDLAEFVELVGTAVIDLIENNPLAAGAFVITLTGHAYLQEAIWLGIEDGTLVDSELVFEVAQAANTVTILDGTTNAHALNTPMSDVAMTKVIVLPFAVLRVRVVVDNTVDAAGSSLNYKVRAVEVTAVA